MAELAQRMEHHRSRQQEFSGLWFGPSQQSSPHSRLPRRACGELAGATLQIGCCPPDCLAQPRRRTPCSLYQPAILEMPLTCFLGARLRHDGWILIGIHSMETSEVAAVKLSFS